ncbi:hypothetical protein AYI70_g6814 [Smittium culicis]|uniref:Uncharacterized protein n=1 Tax=Smittium culicis TaxID=133412 RepID=A0A1R1XNB0_9FUNG|nr:hypothetical protein AYI70_g6814 [Smittium culicis]
MFEYPCPLVEITPPIHGADFIEDEPTTKVHTKVHAHLIAPETVPDSNDEENIQEGFLETASFQIIAINTGEFVRFH